jgi:uncharacterized protein (DUF2267 family)
VNSSTKYGKKNVFVRQKIFLSYAHKTNDTGDITADLVDEIKKRLDAAGHETWIDVEQLSPSIHWRRGITDGIQESDRVLSFLSTRSIRDQGVCLDEIGIALSHKHGAIATIIADKHIENSIPASVGHIQHLMLTEWQSEKNKGKESWCKWLDEKTQEILDIVATNAGFSGEIEELSQKLSPLPNSGKIGRLLEQGLIGREWVKKEIENWRLNRLDQPMFWLVAPPGMGKSAVAANLVHFTKLHAIAYHFCDYNIPESRGAIRFVHNLAFMIAARLPAYMTLLRSKMLLLNKSVHEYSADELMSRLVIDPLRNQIDGGQRKDRFLVIIDALDEALPELPQLLARYIGQLPKWLGFVVTSRPDVKADLAQFPAFELEIESKDNQNDLQMYLQNWSAEIDSQDLTLESQKQLLESSKGNILYLVMARQGYKENRFNFHQLAAYPPGLEGIYVAWLRRQFGSEPYTNEVWTGLVYPLLELLCVTPQALPLDIAAKLLNWRGQDRSRALSAIGSLVTQDGKCLSLFHRSLGEWLARSDNNTPYSVNAHDGAFKLARGLLIRLQFEMSSEGIGFVHLALPYVLSQLDEEQCLELVKSNFTGILDSLDGLADLLNKQFNRFARQAELTLQHWIVRRYDTRGLANEKALKAKSKLANSLSYSGDEAGAKTLREHVLYSLRSLFGPEHPAVLAAMDSLARSLAIMGAHQDAKTLREQVLEGSEKQFGIDHPRVLSAMNNLALSLQMVGEHHKAKEWLERVLEGTRALFIPEHSEVLSAMSNLAILLHDLGEDLKAKVLLEQVLEVLRKQFVPDHPEVLSAMSNLATLLHALGDRQNAMLLREQVLAGRKKLFAPEHPEVLMAMNNLAASLHASGDHLKAWALQEQVLEGSRKLFGPEHPQVLVAMNNLAGSIVSLGDHQKAKVLQERVLEEAKKIFGPAHPEVLLAMHNLAGSLARLGDAQKAKVLREQVLEESKKLFGSEHPEALAAMSSLAFSLEDLGNHQKAKILREQVLDGRRKLFDPEHPEVLSAINDLAFSLESLGDHQKARALREQVLEVRRRQLDPEDPEVLMAKNYLANSQARLGDHQSARTLREQVLEGSRKLFGPEHPQVLRGMASLADSLVNLGDHQHAKVLREQVLEERRKLFGPDHPEVLSAMNNLAVSMHDLGDYQKASELLKQVLERRRKLFAPGHPAVLSAMDNLANTLLSLGDHQQVKALRKEMLGLLNRRGRNGRH